MIDFANAESTILMLLMGPDTALVVVSTLLTFLKARKETQSYIL